MEITANCTCRAPFARGLYGIVTVLDPPLDVLQHDDRVVHDEADGEDQREQREDVEREARRRDPRAGAQQRDGDGHGRDQRGADRGQKDEDHGDHDADRDGERHEDAADRVADVGRVVGRDFERGAVRQIAADVVERRAHRGRDTHRVRPRLAQDVQADGRDAVGAEVAVVILDPQLDIGHVAKTDEVAVSVSDDQFLEFRRVVQTRLCAQQKGPRGGFDLAGRQLDVVLPQRLSDFLDRHAAPGHRVGVEPDPHRVGALAGKTDAGDALNGLEAVHHVAVGVIGQLRRGERLARHREADHRIALGVVLRDLGFLGGFGQVGGDRVDRRAHVRRGLIDVAPGVERDHRAASAELRLGGDRVNPRHSGDRPLDQRRDLRVDDARPRAHIGHADSHLGRVDVRQLPDRHARQPGDAENHDQDAGDRCEHRTAKAEFGQVQFSASSVAPSSSTLTGSPSESVSKPVVTTRASPERPSTISVRPSRWIPMLTSARAATPPSRT